MQQQAYDESAKIARPQVPMSYATTKTHGKLYNSGVCHYIIVVFVTKLSIIVVFVTKLSTTKHHYTRINKTDVNSKPRVFDRLYPTCNTIGKLWFVHVVLLI